MMEEGQAGEETAWTLEEIDKICMEVLEGTIRDQDYIENLVPHWIETICEQCMEKLNGLKKPFKYIVTCAIIQKTGAGVHTATSSFWDSVNDGVHTYVWPKEKKEMGKRSVNCILTIFGLEF